MLLRLMVLKNIIAVFFILFFILSIPVFSLDVEYPVIQSFTYFPYSTDTILGKDKLEFTADLFYSNIYMFDYNRTVINDFEEASAVIGVRYGINRRITAEFYLRSSMVYGGIMDKFIMDFHKVFGLNEGGRGEYPRNTVNIKYKDYFSYSKEMFVLSPPIFGLTLGIYKNRNLEINFRTGMGIPLSSKPGLLSDKAFINTGVISIYGKGDLSLKFSGYISFYKRPSWIDPEEISSRIYLLNGEAEYKKIFAGFLFKSSPFLNGDISNHSKVIYLGYKISDSFKISMFEEIPPMDTVPDVTFRISYVIKVKN